ncbi:hypothetical protein FB45DRAFT_869628 [Roridomyces roridus]|uniref:Uncharacterized protein n=1 Tax=Roridomyces roridus TaxID=1738132 RepID=A0AAD7BLK8_9AGAR|nr:hypothetical protein FB45DRAFT_869628 [Roridomyces roridus]
MAQDPVSPPFPCSIEPATPSPPPLFSAALAGLYNPGQPQKHLQRLNAPASLDSRWHQRSSLDICRSLASSLSRPIRRGSLCAGGAYYLLGGYWACGDAGSSQLPAALRARLSFLQL